MFFVELCRFQTPAAAGFIQTFILEQQQQQKKSPAFTNTTLCYSSAGLSHPECTRRQRRRATSAGKKKKDPSPSIRGPSASPPRKRRPPSTFGSFDLFELPHRFSSSRSLCPGRVEISYIQPSSFCRSNVHCSARQQVGNIHQLVCLFFLSATLAIFVSTVVSLVLSSSETANQDAA